MLQSALIFAVVLLLALVLFRLLDLDRRLRKQPAAVAGPAPDVTGLAAELGGVTQQMDDIAERAVALEERLAAVAGALDWASRKNLAALQSVTAAIDAERVKLEEAGIGTEATFNHVLETAQLLSGVIKTAGDNVWTVAAENDLTLDAKTRYMAERLRYDLRLVVDEVLTDFETRARSAMRAMGIR